MRRADETGAALLEILIALAITAMLAAALTQATRFGLTVVERAQAAGAASTTALIEQRKLRHMLSRIAPASPTFPTARGDAGGFVWRGPVDDDSGAARSGIWRLAAITDGAELSACATFDAPTICTRVDVFKHRGDITFADSDGVFVADWPAGPPPRLIRIGDLVVQPRVTAGER